jgi:hypothetical protein
MDKKKRNRVSDQVNCTTAALVNGTLGYYCDMGSHHAALAVGERQHSSGREYPLGQAFTGQWHEDELFRSA